MNSLAIRVYRPDDLERLKQITVEAFAPVTIERNIEELCGETGGRDWRWRKARHLENDVQRHADGVFVAEEAGAPIGYISTYIDADTRVGFIPNLAVAATHRGRGVGRRLIAHALEFFRERGMEVARIETLEQNAIGQKLYPSMGFHEVARQVHYAMPLREGEPLDSAVPTPGESAEQNDRDKAD